MNNIEVFEKVLTSMLQNVDERNDISKGSFAYDMLKPPAIQFANLQMILEEINKKRDIYNLFGEELDIRVTQNSPLKRQQATFAKGEVTIKGKAGARVPKGMLVSKHNLEYKVDSETNLDENGIAKVAVIALESGTIGNADIGVINNFPTTIQGLETVTNEDKIVNGYEKESDDEFRERYLEYIRLPATSGNVYHYLLWCKEVDGIGRVKIRPLWNGDNTVKIIGVDSNGQPLSEDMKEKLQEYIDPKGEQIGGEHEWTKWGHGYGKAPVGAFCTVESATPLEININAKIKLLEGFDIEEVKKEFIESLKRRFHEVALQDFEVSMARMVSLLLKQDGVYDVDYITLNDQHNNITPLDDEVFVVGEVILSGTE